MNTIKENIILVQDNISNACERANRNPSEITLIAVTKTKPVNYVEAAIEAGVHNVGENKVQEIREKYPVVEDLAKFHMIGHLQSNKVKYIIDKVCLIHSVDSLSIAKKINEQGIKHDITMKVLVQVNIGNEDSKFGIKPEDSEDFIRQISKLTSIQIEGLMAIAPFVADPEDNRLLFRKMKQIFIDIDSKNIDNVNMNILSMGMSNDYVVAIEEGSTMVRVGTAIFGKRDYQNKL